jgi:hypothetical protein
VRWLVIAVVLVSASPGAAFVVEEPGMYYACPGGKTWATVQSCLEKQGRLAILKQLEGAKLVRLDQQENGQWVDAGVYLYVEQARSWKVNGGFFGRGSDYELLDFTALTIGKSTGYRIDIGQASQVGIQLDGVTTQLATRRIYQTMFCGPSTRYCTIAVKSCEVLVRGRAYWTFRGSLRVDGNEVTIAGDRRLSGPFCRQPEKQMLGWPQ